MVSLDFAHLVRVRSVGLVVLLVLVPVVTQADWCGPSEQEFDVVWRFSAEGLTGDERDKFSRWQEHAKFKDVSSQISAAKFMMPPWRQGVVLDPSGRIAFIRQKSDTFSHSFLELAAMPGTEEKAFVRYDGYRSLKQGVMYRLRIGVSVESGGLLDSIPWLLVFQGHAMPDRADIGKKFNPPFALVISRGRWALDIRGDSRLSLPRDKSYQRNERFDLGPASDGERSEFEFFVRWHWDSFRVPGKPEISVWRDKKCVQARIPSLNFYRNERLDGTLVGPYLGVGAYFPNEFINTETVRVLLDTLELSVLPE